MPCPHNEISIVQRSHRQSAVAAAAYQSGEKLFCEYDQEVKHYPEKRGIVHNEILLPANAPLEYTDRNTLWNAAEAVEKQWNSQLARRWVLSIPREIPPDQYAALVRDFCRQQFVSKGMCVDFAIHDKGDGNPHAHVMLTMRAMDERGKWLPKSRKVYELDKNGERIKLPSGRWKSHKEDTVDWNDRKYGEIWRHEWEVIQNRYLEANNRPERVDLRSYERQGLDIIPTVHEGAAVRQMEKRGIQTNIGNLNREIKAANSLMKSIRQLIKNLKGWIAELSEKRNELLAQKAAEEAVFLPNLLMKYMEIRKAERSSWTRAGQSRGTSKDLKAVSEALSYLQRKGLSTVEDLENFIETSGKSAADYRKQMKPKETRSRRQLLKVAKLGPKAFEQCAGFMRIQGGENPLDGTSVHPESYEAAGKLLEKLGYQPEEIAAGGLTGIGKKTGDLKKLAAELGIGEITLADIVKELEKPARDPRDEMPKPILRTDVLEMKDLTPGMILKGTVRNVIDFGAFVDIGVHQDGLVHISQMTDRYIKHPLEAVSVGDIVEVKVLGVDMAKKRISLTMKL